MDVTTAIVIEPATLMLNFVELNFDDDYFRLNLFLIMVFSAGRFAEKVDWGAGVLVFDTIGRRRTTYPCRGRA